MSTSGETHLKNLSLQSQTHYAKLTTLIEDLYRLTWGLYCIHGSKSIDLNESLADIDEFSIMFVCLYRLVCGGHMLVHELLIGRSRLIQNYKFRSFSSSQYRLISCWPYRRCNTFSRECCLSDHFTRNDIKYLH